MKPNREKVAIFGQYKAGTTLLFYKLKNALPAESRWLFEPKRYDPVPVDEHRCVLAKVIADVEGSRRGIAYDSFLAFDRLLFIVRDPRDWLVSGTLFVIQQDPSIYSDERKLQCVMDILSTKETSPTSEPLVDMMRTIFSLSDTNSFETTMSWMERQLAWLITFETNMPAHLLVRYEDMVEDRWDAVASYLGRPLAKAAQVADAHSHVARTCSCGDWKNWFTQKDVDFFQPLFDPYLRQYEYPTSWTTSEAPSIPEAYCTAYVRRAVGKRKGEAVGVG